MNKEKLAIVSSYNDLCGNASYTEALAKGLEDHFDVTVIPLNVELLQKGEPKTARTHVQDICQQLKAFDCANIQFEAGLFGSRLPAMRKNFFTIAKACKRLVLTMHRYHGRIRPPSLADFAKSMLKRQFKAALGDWKQARGHNIWTDFYNDIIQFCIDRKIPVLVHTQRDRELIQRKFNYERIFDHPLCFYSQDHIRSLSCSKAKFCEDFSLDKDKTYIGVFGFINSYKGHVTAIKALKHLPKNYELLIFGSQHPHTIRPDEQINGYIEHLLHTIQNEKMSRRVSFYRMENHDDFLTALLCCDFNVLPYFEVHQGGSAIASLSLETNSSVIFSQNLAFLELAKYARNSFKMFTIGNHLELANAILTYRKSEFAPHLKKYHEKYNISTSVNLYKQLLS